MKPRFFKKPEDFRAWLEKNHDSAKELLVGFWKRDSGKPSITWPESVDEALCFGWIDGIRRRIDDESYTIRFTPRAVKSKWSAVNIKRVAELTELGRMKPAGLAAFEKRDPKSEGYSYERREATLDAAMEKRFRANKAAWTFWEAQPPYYRRTLSWWVISAKREETREKRLEQLIAASAEGRRIT
ncbi:MAG TPA: YdeI/OmpD-associated family protein [Thermoanaerobaculia bacterium]|nr:YdeI/OmpD-associated family protein [Thermoanaerobaculia bacterium]